MTTRAWSAVLIPLIGSLALAAPVPKDKEAKPGPVTDEQLKDSENNLKQIVLAMHNYLDAHGAFPSNVNPLGKEKPAVSWRVLLLPYMEEDALYKEYNFEKAWNSEDNKKLIEKLPKVYQPIRVKTKEKGQTFYRGFAGAGALFEPGQKIGIAAITDGTSNTIAVVEADEPVVWTKPEDLPFDPKKPLPKLGGLFDGEFHIALCDGSVRKVKAKFDADILKAMITRNGGEVADANNLDK
jgi:hypothetical protein